MPENPTPTPDPDKLRELMEKATPGPWEPGWNTRYFGEGRVSMCGRGPDTPVLAPDHPHYQRVVPEQAFADAELIAAAVNALPALLARIGELEGALEQAIGCIRDAEKDTNYLSAPWHEESLADVLERTLIKRGEASDEPA